MLTYLNLGSISSNKLEYLATVSSLDTYHLLRNAGIDSPKSQFSGIGPSLCLSDRGEMCLRRVKRYACGVGKLVRSVQQGI